MGIFDKAKDALSEHADRLEGSDLLEGARNQGEERLPEKPTDQYADQPPDRGTDETP